MTENNYRMQISSGCQVSSLLLVIVLSIEYLIFFLNPTDFSLEFDANNLRRLFIFVGYVLITKTLTCNNHGRKVILRYERELSVIFKNVIADVILFCFVLDVFVFLLCLVQTVTLIIIFVIYGIFFSKRNHKNILYIYDNKKPDCDNVIHVDEALRRLEQEHSSLFEGFSHIYLYDVSAVKRNDILKAAAIHGIDVYINAKLSDLTLRASYLTSDGDNPIFYCAALQVSKSARVIKRCFDVIVSSILLIILSPLFLLIAIAIKLEDGGDIFFRQERVTVDDRRFKILKFRSMVMDAEERRGAARVSNMDSRITKVGYILRKFKLDELPQLINILNDDMSFVGPRPERPELLENIVESVPEFAFRTQVKAGLTGYAQVHGDYHTDFLEKLKWDLIYIENYSLILDLKILLMTIPTVFRGSSDIHS